jgi:hypothetical protein
LLLLALDLIKKLAFIPFGLLKQLQAQIEMLTIKYDLFSNQYLGVKIEIFKSLSILANCAK